MNAVGYIRGSTEEQVKEGVSLDNQRKRIEAFCVAKEWTLGRIYADEGISGSNLKREGVQELISDCKKSVFDVVVIYKLDRLTRSVKDLGTLIEVFDKSNVAFSSVLVIMLILACGCSYKSPVPYMPVSEMDDYTKGLLDGENDAYDSYEWTSKGFIFPVYGVILAWKTEPTPPAYVLIGMSPEYVKGYSEAYQHKNIWAACFGSTCCLAGVYAVIYAVNRFFQLFGEMDGCSH